MKRSLEEWKVLFTQAYNTENGTLTLNDDDCGQILDFLDKLATNDGD